MKKITTLLVLAITTGVFAQINDPAPYCATGYTTNYNMITSLSFNGTNFAGFGPTGSWTNTTPYRYFNTTSLNPINPGQSFTLSITFPSVNDAEPRYFAVWIDFNKNNIFEASELVMQNSNTTNAELPVFQTGASATATKVINVPNNAVIGSTRMRIRRGQNDANPYGPYDANLVLNPCAGLNGTQNAFGYNCTTDFNVQIGGGISEITLFEDNFDNYANFIIANIGNWTLIDNDLRNTYGVTGFNYPNSSAPKSFMIFNSTATTPAMQATSGFSAYSPNNAMACFASIPGNGINANNDWMITPQIQLGATGNSLTFWAKSASATYPNEKLRVGISNTGTLPTNFTFISPVVTTTTTWTSYTYDLAAYANQNIRIGINCTSDDQFALLIDNFKVVRTQTLSSDNAFEKEVLNVYPNPVESFLSIKIDGLESIELYNLNGVQIEKAIIYNDGIDFSNLASGLYILK